MNVKDFREGIEGFDGMLIHVSSHSCSFLCTRRPDLLPSRISPLLKISQGRITFEHLVKSLYVPQTNVRLYHAGANPHARELHTLINVKTICEPNIR